MTGYLLKSLFELRLVVDLAVQKANQNGILRNVNSLFHHMLPRNRGVFERCLGFEDKLMLKFGINQNDLTPTGEKEYTPVVRFVCLHTYGIS